MDSRRRTSSAQREKSRYTPIIFVTALSRSESNVFKGYSLGAVDYLFKPIVPEILRSKVSVFVDLFRKNQAVRLQAIELSRLSRKTELILNSAADGVIGVDTAGLATFVNPSALQMLGVSDEDVVGQDVHDVLHPRIPDVMTCDRDHCCVRAALLGEEMYDVQDQGFWRSDGTIFPVEYSAAPMRSRGDDLVGAVLSFRDVSEKRAAARAKENERLYREAEAASSAKDDFLASLSHELRTPMTAILGWLQMLKLDDVDEATRHEALQTIESSARLQAQLIDDMLDVSRIIMGKFRVNKVATDLVPLASSAIEALRPVAEEKGVVLKANLGASDSKVCVDGARIRQVLSNLLSNAIKFTPSGGHVSCDIRSTPDMVILRVADTGEGLSREFLPHIFERLQQSESARNLGGLGLGLAIARHIVELHEGKIEVESEGVGKGSTFTVSLPLLVADEVEG
jgi:PAS domain S-box-containing protein